jgi:hypothetical protein
MNARRTRKKETPEPPPTTSTKSGHMIILFLSIALSE